MWLAVNYSVREGKVFKNLLFSVGYGWLSNAYNVLSDCFEGNRCEECVLVGWKA